MIPIFFNGFVMGTSLIIAIGLQNAFVLRQGIKQRHVFITALTAALCDITLIGAGVLGFGALVESAPWLLDYITWGGIAFLVAYAVKSFISAAKPKTMEQQNAKGLLKDDSAKSTIILILSVSLLNPHAYLDTLVLLGGLSAAYEGAGKYVFGAGAMLGSLCWFFSLAYGARYLAPIFQKSKSWQILDALIGIVMLIIAASLFLHMQKM